MMPPSPWIGSIRIAAVLRRDGAFHRGEIAERHRAETGRERPEAVLVIGLRGEADNGRGAAMEIAFRDDDLGTIVRECL